MNRRAVVIGAVGGAAAAAGLGVAVWRQASRGDPALAALWSTAFEQPGGGTLSFAGWRGRPFVLNFWATWCPPCVKEMPQLDRFHREQGESGWQVAGLAIDAPTPVREFLLKVPVSFPIGLAGLIGTDLVRTLGNVQGGLPFTVLVDREQRIAWRKMGETSYDELRRETARRG